METKKRRGRPRKEDVIIVDHSDEDVCPECAGRKVYEAGFKWWKTCPRCRGEGWIKRE